MREADVQPDGAEPEIPGKVAGCTAESGLRKAAVQPDGAEPEIPREVRRRIPETNIHRMRCGARTAVKQRCSLMEQNLKFSGK